MWRSVETRQSYFFSSVQCAGDAVVAATHSHQFRPCSCFGKEQNSHDKQSCIKTAHTRPTRLLAYRQKVIGLLVIGFALLMIRMVQVANRARSDFESLMVIGVATMVMFQVVVNIFMTIGLGPVTGIPLPFMSYGRSAMVVNFIALGLCLSVARRGRMQQLR